ncbi:MAG: YhjD/YihY/BrkB family envelope integrity protein [Methylocella sp.]
MFDPEDGQTIVDPKDAAESAGLRYVLDVGPGIRRKKSCKGFTYVRLDGTKLSDAPVVRRIPPAWTDVWICPVADGHIQATGRDAKGRKQYRYHPQFREVRESTKYEHIVAFANALPAIRAKVREHIARRGLPREKVLATVVHLLNILGHKGDGRSDSARTKVRQFKADPKGKPSPIPLENCPWCETRFEPASFTLLPDDDKPRKLRIVCANFECEFARRPLPIVAVDEPIYPRLPAFLIAIVDKFASLPWVNALNTVWKVEARKKVGIWQFVRTYLVSLAGVLALGFLLLASLLLRTALSASGKYLSPHLPEATLHIVGSIMFKWLPDTSVRWRDVWLGAAITAALFEIGKLLISAYGKQALESTRGAAASLVVLLIWIYHSSQIVVMGAEFRMCVRAVVVPASPAGKNGATGNYEGDRDTVMMMILSPGVPATLRCCWPL